MGCCCGTSPCLPELLKSQDKRCRGSKTAPWIGARLTFARTCKLAFTCSPALQGYWLSCSTLPVLGAQGTVKSVVPKADTSTGVVAPGREGSGILIVCHGGAQHSLGRVKRVHGWLKVEKAHPHSLHTESYGSSLPLERAGRLLGSPPSSLPPCTSGAPSGEPALESEAS
jgi:hypothetical protein